MVHKCWNRPDCQIVAFSSLKTCWIHFIATRSSSTNVAITPQHRCASFIIGILFRNKIPITLALYTAN